MCQFKIFRAIILVASFVAVDLFATTIALPTPKVVAAYGARLLVRIEPGSNQAQSQDFTKPFSEENAKAVYLRFNESSNSYEQYQTVILANGIAPAEAYLEKDGILITLENFGTKIENGPLVAIYSATGRVVATYGLADLYSSEVAKELIRSELNYEYSWRSYKEDAFLAGNRFVIPDAFGNMIQINIYNGSFEYRGNAPQRYPQ